MNLKPSLPQWKTKTRSLVTLQSRTKLQTRRLWTKTCVSEEMWNGQGKAELDQTVIDQRPQKLTEKGKGYRLVQRKGERNKLKRKIQSQIANISTLLGHDKNLELISDLSIKLNDLFEQFGDLHEEIQELLTNEE